MRAWLAKRLDWGFPRGKPGTTVLRSLVLAALAQVLKWLFLLPLVAFFLDLSAVFSLRRVFAGRSPAAEDPAVQPPPAARGGRRLCGWLLSTAGITGAVACSLALSEDFARYLFTVLLVGPLSLLALGIGEDLCAGYGFGWRPGHHADESPRPSVSARTAAGVLLCILAVGAVFRFAPVGSFPPSDGFSSIEEMQRASGATAILDGARPWEFPLAQYLAAASFFVFGPSMNALRLPVTILGWLTLPLFYLLARRLVERPAALFATALLAVSRWHCQVGWYDEDVYVPLFPFVLLLYLLMRTRREARPSLYVAAGALCGYMLYDYAAYRSAPIVVAGFFAAEALWHRRWPPGWRPIALLFAVVVLFALPLRGLLGGDRGAGFYLEAIDRSVSDTSYYTSDPRAFLRRRLNRINTAVDAFTSSDHFEFFPTLNLPYAPLLDPFSSVFFTLGFGTTLLLPRRRYRAYFAGAFLFLATGAMVVPWNFDFRRLAILIPFVFLFTALLAQEIELEIETEIDVEGDREGGHLATAAGWQARWRSLMVLVALAATACNAYFLFVRLAPDHEVRASHRTPYTVALERLKHYQGEFVLALSPEMPNFFESNDYNWLKPRGLHGRIARGVEDLLGPDPALPPRRDLLLLIARPYDILTVVSQVLDVYPHSTCSFHPDADNRRHDIAVCRVRRQRGSGRTTQQPSSRLSPSSSPAPLPDRRS